MDPSERPKAVGLLPTIVLLTVVVRLAMIFGLQTYRQDAGAFEHGDIARSIVTGGGFRFPFFSAVPLATSQQAPIQSYVLAACYGVAGVQSPTAHLLALLVNVVLSAAAVVALAVIARQLWGRRVSWIAGIGMAVYPALAYMVTRVQAVNWSVAGLLVTMALLMMACRSGRAWHALAAGAVAGLSLLAEPILAAPFAGMVLAMSAAAWRRGEAALRVRLPVAFVLTVACVIAPWTARNVLVHGRPAFIKDSFWYVFWQGNNLHATGTDKLPVNDATARQLAWRLIGAEEAMAAARRESLSVDTTLTGEQLAEIHGRPTETAKMDWFREDILRQLRASPAHYLRMCGIRLVQMIWFDPTNPRAFAMAYRGPYLVLALLALGGVIRIIARKGPGHSVAMAGDSTFPAVAFGALLLVHTLVITSARFRLPLEALMLLPASYLIDELLTRFRSRGR